MQWMRCEACTHIFVDGYFTEEAEEILFSRVNPNQMPQWSFDHNQRLISSRIVEFVSRHLGRCSGRWLEVGFGNASLLTTAEEFGFDVVGLDSRAESAKALNEMGFEAHSMPLQRFEAAPFDVIAMADVLEHFAFPKEGLVAAHRLLVPGGLLFLSMPNIDCFSWKARDRADANPYWGEIEHYHNFGRRRLHALLEEHGFTPIAYRVNERYFVGMEVLATRR